MDADDLLRLHVEALYLLRDGRLRAVNQWDGGRVPRLHVGITAQGPRAWYREDVPAELVTALEAVVTREKGSRPGQRSAYKALLAELGPTEDCEEGPAYALPGTVLLPEPTAGAQAATVEITRGNEALLAEALADWLPDVGQRAPFLATVVHGHAVAVCASARETAAACEAAVATAAAYRRQGFAAQAVAAWATRVRGRGRLPLYSTSWDNHASQALAASLGFVLYGADLKIF